MISNRCKSVLLVAVLLLAGTALAGSIYLNGVRIDGVANQKFEKCTVTIDAKGDVYIDAPGYAAQGVQPSSAAASPVQATTAAFSPGGITQRYWLVKEENYPGKTQYDIDIFINSVWFKRVRSDTEQVVLEITKNLRPGPNVIHFAATKNIAEQRKSFSPQVYLRLIVGEGNIGGKNVMIENPLIQYKRTAEEVQNFNDEFTVTAR
jgi:hypothetical protein